MGNSTSAPENNYTEIQKIKDVLATKTEAFTNEENNKKVLEENSNNYTEMQKIKDVLDADTETFQYNKENKEYSETSEMQKYTESNANQPFYNEYMQAKEKYLALKNNN